MAARQLLLRYQKWLFKCHMSKNQWLDFKESIDSARFLLPKLHCDHTL